MLPVLSMTNRKLHMRFQLAPKSMTLNCYKFEFSRNVVHLVLVVCHLYDE